MTLANTFLLHLGMLFLVPLFVIFLHPLIILTRFSPLFRDFYYKCAVTSFYHLCTDSFKPVRKKLFSWLDGKTASNLRVLEIGPGSGANLPFYPPGTKLTTLELSPLLEKLIKQFETTCPSLVHEKSLMGNAEKMSQLESGSFSTIVGTQIFCCIENPPQALKEIHRVLEPNGRFFFHELVAHKREEGLIKYAFQRLSVVFWNSFGLGCKSSDQDVDQLLRDANFKIVESRRHTVTGLPFTHNLVSYGVAVKQGL
jgi:ubiquinone/menaquinone biosynthesis C-methylase UbiE